MVKEVEEVVEELKAGLSVLHSRRINHSCMKAVS